MEYIKAIIGGLEMFIPVNDKLGKMILVADKKIKHQKRIAKARNVYKGTIDYGHIIMGSEFFYAFEDILECNGYCGLFHNHFNTFFKEQRKILYDLFRDDITVHYLVAINGYEEELIQNTIREFFLTLKNYFKGVVI